MLPDFNSHDEEIIFDHFDYADFVDGNASYIDSFLGLGNKQKKAERKLAKAEKQREKGHIKNAERKTEKADKILSKYKAAQDKLISAQDKKQAIGDNKQVLDAQNTQQTESGNTTAGQIGEVAGQMSTTAPTMSGTGGGGGGDMSSGDLPMYPEATSGIPTDTNDPTKDPTTQEDLPNVTVVGHPSKDNTITYVIIGVALLALVYFFFIRRKK
jgi:LPXTG-motif cell wall-anchored protein